jgi:hypothetical protein
MNRGRLVKEGKTEEIVKDYLATGAKLATGELVEREDRVGKGKAIVTGVQLLDSNGDPLREAVSGSDVTIRVTYHVKDRGRLAKCVLCLAFYKDLDCFFGLSTSLSSKEELQIEGDGYVDFHVPSWPLAGGRYRIDTYLEGGSEIQDQVDDASQFDTIDGDFFGTGRVCHDDHWRKFVLVPHSWRHRGM